MLLTKFSTLGRQGEVRDYQGYEDVRGISSILLTSLEYWNITTINMDTKLIVPGISVP